jgi:opacity protein-like surface antigen
MKKFLISAAAIAALATSAMAYDVFPANELTKMTYANNVTATSGKALSESDSDQGSVLIYPHLFVGGSAGLTSKIRVINPSSNDVVAKLVIYDGKDSREVKDFNIYLSANDVWEGTLKKR